MCDNFAFLYPRTGKNVVKKASHGMNIFLTFKFVGFRSSIKRLFFCFCFLGWKSVTIIKPSVWFYTNLTWLPPSYDIEVLPPLRHSFVARIIINYKFQILSIDLPSNRWNLVSSASKSWYSYDLDIEFLTSKY